MPSYLKAPQPKAPPDPSKELEGIFASFDKDGNGAIDASELSELAAALGMPMVTTLSPTHTHTLFLLPASIRAIPDALARLQACTSQLCLLTAN